MSNNLFVVGLTGGIASGKTLVSNLFAALDVPVVDADVIARDIVAKGSAGLVAIRKQFGEQILDHNGALDRANLRQIIFTDISKKLILENILHPLIMAEALQRLEQLSAAYAIYVIPLLVEKKLQARVDRILLVDCRKSVQIERLMERDNCSRKQARNILKNQATRRQRLAAADDVITNENDIASVEQQVLILHKNYRVYRKNS